MIVRIEAFPHRDFRGTVEQVGGATEPQQGGDAASPWMLQQVPIRVKFDRESQPVKPGLSCQVWVDVR